MFVDPEQVAAAGDALDKIVCPACKRPFYLHNSWVSQKDDCILAGMKKPTWWLHDGEIFWYLAEQLRTLSEFPTWMVGSMATVHPGTKVMRLLIDTGRPDDEIINYYIKPLLYRATPEGRLAAYVILREWGCNPDWENLVKTTPYVSIMSGCEVWQRTPIDSYKDFNPCRCEPGKVVKDGC